MSLIEAERQARGAPTPGNAKGPSHTSISVVGLGPIGIECVTEYVAKGYRVVGVDVDLAKVRALKDGKSPFADERGGEAIADGVRLGLVEATQNIVAAVIDTDVTMLPVSGADMAFVRAASRAIGQALSLKDGFHAIVLTGFSDGAGIVETVARECATASGRKLGADFGICVSPLLWRGDAEVETGWPMRTLIRASDSRAARLVEPLLAAVAE